jgi:hypothetical protein
MRLPALVSLAILAALAPVASARAEPTQDLIALYRLTVSNELCNFPLTSAQSDELTRRAEELESSLALSDDASTRLYEQVETQMTKQVEAGLCKPGGAWARDYARQVEALTPPK